MPQHIMEPVSFRSGLKGGLPTPAQAAGQVPVIPQPAAAVQRQVSQPQNMGYRNEGPMILLDEIGSGIEEFLRSIFGGEQSQQGAQPQQAQGAGGYAVDPYFTMGDIASPADKAARVRQAQANVDPALSPPMQPAPASAQSSGLPTPPASPLAGVSDGAVNPFTSGSPIGAQQSFAPDDASMLQPQTGSFENSPAFSGEGFSASAL